MADGIEKRTLRLLQEMRGEVRASFDSVDARFDGANLRIDGLSHMRALLAGNVASHEVRVESLEEKLEALPAQ